MEALAAVLRKARRTEPSSTTPPPKTKRMPLFSPSPSLIMLLPPMLLTPMLLPPVLLTPMLLTLILPLQSVAQEAQRHQEQMRRRSEW